MPDASPVDEDLQGVGGVQGLVVVQDEHIAPQGVYTCGVHRRVLEGRGRGREREREREKERGIKKE